MNDGTANAPTFGIYPGSAVGDTGPAGPPDRPDKISQALGWLQSSPGRPFIVRAYDAHADQGDTAHPAIRQTPAGYDRYLGSGRRLDLVAQYHSRSGDTDGYCAFIENLIDRHGEHIATLQIGEEPPKPERRALAVINCQSHPDTAMGNTPPKALNTR